MLDLEPRPTRTKPAAPQIPLARLLAELGEADLPTLRAHWHPGLHAAIIPQDLFDAVQVRLDVQKRRQTEGSPDQPRAPLTGRIFDADGHPMSPTTARGRSGCSYRYYVSAPLQQRRAAEPAPGASNGMRRGRGAAKGTTGADPDRVTALRRVASDAIEARIGAVLTRLLPDAPGDPLQVPLRIELHPGALHILLPVKVRATAEAHLIAGEALAQEAGAAASTSPDPAGVPVPRSAAVHSRRTPAPGPHPRAADRGGDPALLGCSGADVRSPRGLR